MDNLTHTLVGAALGRAGLGRRTALARPALLIGANLPDIDVLGLPFGHNLGFRRGITHGILALGLWPFVLTGLLLAWDRHRRRRNPERPVPAARALLAISGIAVLSHPLLDWFNSYGMRWLMPFRDTWSYGDTWFIVDPLVLAVLILGLTVGRRRAGAQPQEAPARVALVVLTGYALVMGGWSAWGRSVVREEVARLGFPEPRAVMVTPEPLNPAIRRVVVDDGNRIHRGLLTLTGRITLDPAEVLPSRMAEVDSSAVRADAQGRQFLRWARFPFARFVRVGDTLIVQLDDARYSDGVTPSFAATEVRMPPRP